MEQFLNSFLGKIIRFLLFLPLASLASILTNMWAQWFAYIDPVGFTFSGVIFHSIITGGLPSYVFVFVGCSVIPSFKKTLSIILSFIIVLLSGLYLVQNAKTEYSNDGILGVLLSWENILLLIASMLGAIIASTSVFENDKINNYEK